MMKNSVFTGIFALFLFSCLAFFSACRSAPPTPQPPSEAPEQQSKETQEPKETAKPPIESSPPPKPPAIVRSLPESLLAMPEKDSAALKVDYNTVLNIRTVETRNGFWRYRTARQGNKLVGFEFS